MSKKKEEISNDLMVKTIWGGCTRDLSHCPTCDYTTECKAMIRAGVPKLYQFSDGSYILTRSVNELIAATAAAR